MADGARRNRGGGGSGERSEQRRRQARGGIIRHASGTTTAVAPTSGQATATATGEAATARPTTGSRLRRFAVTMAGIDGVALLLLLIPAVLAVALGGRDAAVLPSALAAMWMVLNLGGCIYDGVVLTMLPVLPAMAFTAWGAWRVRREVSGPVSVRDVRVLAAYLVATPAVLTLLAWVVLDQFGPGHDLEAPGLPRSLAAAVVLHVVMLAWGLGRKLLTALLRRRRLPEWPLASGALAASVTGWLWMAGGVLAVISMLVSWDALADLWRATGDTSGTAGKVGGAVISLLYLPNIAASAAGILVGAPANIGIATVDIFHVEPGALPPLPILTAMPQSHWGPWLMGLFAVPIAIVLWRTSRLLAEEDPRNPYAVVVTAAVIAAVLMGGLAWLTSGIVGWYGQSGLDGTQVALLTSIWVAAPAAVLVIVLMFTASRRAAKAGEEPKEQEGHGEQEVLDDAQGDTTPGSDPEETGEPESAGKETPSGEPGEDGAEAPDVVKQEPEAEPEDGGKPDAD